MDSTVLNTVSLGSVLGSASPRETETERQRQTDRQTDRQREGGRGLSRELTVERRDCVFLSISAIEGTYRREDQTGIYAPVRVEWGVRDSIWPQSPRERG